jgi:two-component system sensor histidine kinase UhpB
VKSVSTEAGQGKVGVEGPPLTGETLELLLSEGVLEAIGERDLDTNTIHWSGNFESIFGHPRDEVVGHLDWWREHVHPDDIERVMRVAGEAIRGNARSFPTEYRFRRKDGSWAWVAARGVIVRDSEGRARRVVGSLMDITALRETESRLRLFTEQLPARATVTDRELRVVWDAGAAYPGNPSTVGKTVGDLFADSPDRERVLEGCRQALRGDVVRLVIKDGTVAADLQLAPFRDAGGNISGVVGLAFDITDRKQTEEALRESRELFRTVLNTVPAGVVVMDTSGNVTLANPSSDRIWGRIIASGEERWRRSQAYWHDTGVKIQPGDWASVRALSRGETTLNELMDIVAFDGTRKIIENSVAPIRHDDGSIVGAVVINEDVTERVRAEEALRNTQRLLLDAERLGVTGSWEQDLVTGEIVNSDASRRLFFGDDTSKGARLEDYADAVHPDDRNRVMTSREAMLNGAGSGDIEYRVVWPDGSVHVIFGRATVVRDDSGKAVRVYGTNADITARKQTEEELARRAGQLETLSRKLIDAQEAERRAVALELHDDLGQMLFGLKLSLQRSGRDESESIALVDGAIGRMRDVVQALRPPLLDEFGLPAALTAYVEREATRAGLKFHLAIDLLEKRLPVTVEVTCFRVAQEALANVIRHAQAKEVDIELIKHNDRLRLIVRDDGHGFDVAAARRRAAIGASHGLLSMQERVTLVGGDLEIDSTPGRGTSVRARLPCTTLKAAQPAKRRRPKHTRPKKRKKSR